MTVRSQTAPKVEPTRVVGIALALSAVALGALVVFLSGKSLALGFSLFAFVLALTLPRDLVPVVLAGLIPFQIYFFVTDAWTMRVALVFVFAAAVRLSLERGLRTTVRGQVWLVPAALFLIVALVAAIDAPSRYGALRGIYSWVGVFGCAFVVSQTVRYQRIVRQMLWLLIVAGVIQALLGLVQYVTPLSTVLAILSLPASQLLFHPSLLNEKLGDLTFNWVYANRALPFGTFVNSGDYAAFLAVVLIPAMAFLFETRNRTQMSVMMAAVVLMTLALVLSLKASGWIAFLGGGIALAWFFLPRLTSRHPLLAVLMIIAVLLVVVPFVPLLTDRIIQLAVREQGLAGTMGRLQIWSSLMPSIFERPWFGSGHGSSIYLTELTRSVTFGTVVYSVNSAEGAYVATLVETGLVGFAALMTLFAMALARGLRVARSTGDAASIGVFAGTVAILVGNVTYSGFLGDHSGMLLGTLLGLAFTRREDE